MPIRDEYAVRQIGPDDRLTGLSLGDQEFLALKIFLQRHAKSYHERHLARTYAAFSTGRVVGYVTLVCGEIVLEGDGGLLDEPDFRYNYKSYPALKRIPVTFVHKLPIPLDVIPREAGDPVTADLAGKGGVYWVPRMRGG